MPGLDSKGRWGDNHPLRITPPRPTPLQPPHAREEVPSRWTTSGLYRGDPGGARLRSWLDAMHRASPRCRPHLCRDERDAEWACLPRRVVRPRERNATPHSSLRDWRIPRRLAEDATLHAPTREGVGWDTLHRRPTAREWDLPTPRRILREDDAGLPPRSALGRARGTATEETAYLVEEDPGFDRLGEVIGASRA